MDGLTLRQQEILDFIRGFVESEGMPPTRAELARAFGFKSPASAEEHLRALEKKGAITLSGMARGLRLTEPSGLPLVGQVAAGAPLLAAENVVGHYPVSPNLFKLRADYLLKVRGWSMRDAGILDGDTVIIHECDTANTGEIIVALVDNEEATLKRLRRRGDSIALEAANPAYETRLYGSDRVKVQGKLVGLIRRY